MHYTIDILGKKCKNVKLVFMLSTFVLYYTLCVMQWGRVSGCAGAHGLRLKSVSATKERTVSILMFDNCFIIGMLG